MSDKHLDPAWHAEEIGTTEDGRTVYESAKPEIGQFTIGTADAHGHNVGRQSYNGPVKHSAKHGDKEKKS